MCLEKINSETIGRITRNFWILMEIFLVSTYILFSFDFSNSVLQNKKMGKFSLMLFEKLFLNTVVTQLLINHFQKIFQKHKILIKIYKMIKISS